jgi:acetone carboxylase gamma subunit
MDRRVVEDLIDGRLSWPQLKEIIVHPKDPARFQVIMEVLRERLGWQEPVLLPLAEHLYVVQKGTERVVRCDCGCEFGDYRENWKTKARVFVRDDESLLREIYPQMMHSDPQWMVLREFYCPGCFTLLEVEAVPPGYPVLFDFQPDIDGFYEWLGLPLPSSARA